MRVVINGNFTEIDPSESSVSQILTAYKVTKPEMVSVQLNEKFVEQDQYANIRLRENDELEFIYFMGGGSESLS